MPIVTLFFLNLIAALSSFLFVARCIRLSGRVDALISWFIIYFAQIVFSSTLLGALGRLSLGNIILLNLLILLLILFFTRGKGSSFPSLGLKGYLRDILNDKTALFVTCAILGFAMVKVAINLINPPFGWDDLNYHFTFPVEWLKYGNLSNPMTVFDEPGPSYYPIDASLFFLWFILPLKNVFLADLGQVPFFGLAFLAVYGLSGKLGLTRRSGYLAASLFTLIPNYFKQMEIAYVDVMVGALFLVSLLYLFILKSEFNMVRVFMFGSSIGLFLGVKTVSLSYSVLLFAPLIYICLKNLKKTPLAAMVFILTAVALGGFTYLRNIFETGNPLYPLDFNFLGRSVLKGVMDITTFRAHFKASDYSLAKMLFHEGLGGQAILFVLPASFLALPVYLIRNKGRKSLDLLKAYTLMLPLLVYLIWRLVIPLANTRYLYCLLGMGMVMGFYLAEQFKVKRYMINILTVICALSSVAELAQHSELVASLVLTAMFFITYLVMSKRAPVFRLKPGYIVISVLFIIVSLIGLNKDYARNEYARYVKMTDYSGFWPDAAKAWDWLNANTKADNIAYAGRPVPFPLYGMDFKNNVYYVSVNRVDPAKLHYFPDGRYRWGYDFMSLHQSLKEKGNYRFGADYSAWRENLLKRNTDYLFVYSLHQTEETLFPVEDNWARDNPDLFIRVFANETVHIYRLLEAK